MNNNARFAVFYVTMISIALAASLYASSLTGSSTFVLEWPPEQQEIVDGTFRIELTLEWEHESLSITIKINDDEYNRPDRLALVFFTLDENGEVDLWHDYEPYLFTVNNFSAVRDKLRLYSRDNLPWHPRTPYNINGQDWHPGQDEELATVEGVDPYNLFVIKSPYHNCTFTEGAGYTFDIIIPKSELVNATANVMYVLFYDGYNLFIQDPDRLTYYDWVSRRVWGWR
jgi:hypothetical protein